MADTPAPLPSLGLLDGLGTAVAPAEEPAFVWQDPVPAAFFADIGFAAIYAWMPLGIPVNARDEVAEEVVNQGGDPAFLPHIGLLLAPTIPEDPVIPWLAPLPHLFIENPALAAVYQWSPLGTPVANRDEVIAVVRLKAGSWIRYKRLL